MHVEFNQSKIAEDEQPKHDTEGLIGTAIAEEFLKRNKEELEEALSLNSKTNIDP